MNKGLFEEVKKAIRLFDKDIDLRQSREKLIKYCKLNIYKQSLKGYYFSESFIREFGDEIGWFHVSYTQKLSEDFIREFKHKVDWNIICHYQILSEDFIREFKDKVYWGVIYKKQKLSPEFIIEFKDKFMSYIQKEYSEI